MKKTLKFKKIIKVNLIINFCNKTMVCGQGMQVMQYMTNELF